MKEARDLLYRVAHCHFCESNQSPKEIGALSAFLCEILNYLVVKCQSESQSCFLEAFLNVLQMAVKKWMTIEKTNIISGSFKTRLTHSGLEEQLPRINRYQSATHERAYVYEERNFLPVILSVYK